MRSRLIGVPLTLLGGAGFAGALASLYTGMRHVMRTQGGFCASGGPYVIAQGHQCSNSDVRLILIGIFGMLLAAGALLVGLAMLKGPVLAGALAMWAALFGALGWNFLSLGFNPPPGQSGADGWIACGIVFWLMAVGGLVPLVAMSVGWARDRTAKGAYG
jgi:hypothetical protein